MKIDDFSQDCYSVGKFDANSAIFGTILRYDCPGTLRIAQSAEPEALTGNGPLHQLMPKQNKTGGWCSTINQTTPLKAIRTGFNRSTHDERNRRFAWNDSRT